MLELSRSTYALPDMKPHRHTWGPLPKLDKSIRDPSELLRETIPSFSIRCASCLSMSEERWVAGRVTMPTALVRYKVNL